VALRETKIFSAVGIEFSPAGSKFGLFFGVTEATHAQRLSTHIRAGGMGSMAAHVRACNFGAAYSQRPQTVDVYQNRSIAYRGFLVLN